MKLETVLYDAQDGIARIRLNRPHRLNAMVPQLMRDLHQAFMAAAGDAAVRVVILSGEGRAFCAGDDLKESAEAPGDVGHVRQFVAEIQQVTVDMKTMPKPIIGAIHGYAVGGGCELALDCDLVVAAEDAKFGFPETGVGLFVTGGITHFLPRAVGLARAKELIMTGEFFDGREALRLGLVNRAVGRDQVLSVAEALARTIMEKAPIPIAMTKVALEAGVQSDLATAMALETASTVTCFLSEDAREGARAFVREAPAALPRALTALGVGRSPDRGRGVATAFGPSLLTPGHKSLIVPLPEVPPERGYLDSYATWPGPWPDTARG